MVNRLTICWLLILTIGHVALARAGPPTTQQAQAAIEAIEKDPLAAGDGGHIAAIMTFAEQNPDVSVVLDANILPFMRKPKEDDHAPLLLAAFVAGNVKPQLANKVNRDHSYAGLQQVFKTYHAIRASKPNYRNPEIERLEGMDKEGKLRAYVEEIVAKHKDAPTTAPR